MNRSSLLFSLSLKPACAGVKNPVIHGKIDEMIQNLSRQIRFLYYSFQTPACSGLVTQPGEITGECLSHIKKCHERNKELHGKNDENISGKRGCVPWMRKLHGMMKKAGNRR
ncbi:MAG: hypothetical protein LUQ41_05310 [Methanomicrobiales archaeon]|nr:hypothetical protein [Methanomicrobiales archaeon]